MKSINTKLKQLFSNNQLMFLVGLLCLFLTSTILGLGDWDFVWQSYLGKAIVTEHNFNGLADLIWGNINIYPYYDHEWLTNIGFYAATVLFGPTYSIIAVKIVIELLMGIATFLLVKCIVKDFNNIHYISYFVCMLMTYTLATLLVKPKAYDLSVVLLMLLLIVLEKRKENLLSFKRFSLYIISLAILWNNIHSGSISLIFIFTGAYWLCYWRDKKTVVLGLITLLSLGLNPFGYKLVWFDVTHFSDDIMRTIIRDWHCLDLKMIAGKAICLMLVLILVYLFNMERTKDNLVYYLLFIGLLVMTISSMRHFLYMYPVGLIIVLKGQYTFDCKYLPKTFGVTTYFIMVFTVFLLLMFGINFQDIKTEYTMSYITPQLEDLLNKTAKEDNDGLFTGDINVWSSGLKSFQSGAFPHTRTRTIDSYVILRGSEQQIEDIIEYYSLDKFLFYKKEDSPTGYTLHTTLYDYFVNHPDKYVLLYDDDIVVYVVNKEVYDAIK